MKGHGDEGEEDQEDGVALEVEDRSSITGIKHAVGEGGVVPEEELYSDICQQTNSIFHVHFTLLNF